MNVFLTCILVGTVVFSVCHCTHPLPELEEEWYLFKENFNKVYTDEREEIQRRLIFEDNLDFIQQHNDEYSKGLHSFTLGINEFADLSHDEFLARMVGGFRLRQEKRSREEMSFQNNGQTLPDSIDWRSKGCVGPVGNQNQCGSCWAFTATGSLEGIYCKQTGKFIVLSVQQLMDCSSKQGNHGCEGGIMDNSFTYIKECGGIMSAKDYPYEPKEEKCKFNKSLAVVTDTGFKDIPKGSEKDLQAAVATVGPISAAIDASHRSFQLYKSGVYNEPQCNGKVVDHSLVVVGYSAMSGIEYWDCKNSWGTSWGDQGYVKLSRNKNNQCGIANEASYPTGVTHT